MSVVGFDFGNESCLVAVARQRGIDVVLNDESKRETPAIVCFGDKQRFIGTAGAASSMMNPKNTISQIKRLIGRKFSDPELQRDARLFPFQISEGPDGFPLIHVRYLNEARVFTPTQVLGMIFGNLKTIAEKNLNAAVVDCCIGVPVYFADLQRRCVIDAAKIAGLNPLRLFHETTATALGYGIYKTDLPENEYVNVAFVDVGHASMQVCIAGFKKGQLKILSHAYDRSLGGRDFDEVLFKYFAEKFKAECKIDVETNATASLRLRAGCEKLKKMLSANPEAPLSIKCLMNEKDVRGFIKREEFESLSTPILERVKGPLEKALKDAGLTVENIHSVEVVGSGSRVPVIIRVLSEFFGKEPRRTTNASECVARGCALQCAILTPTFRVREFQAMELSQLYDHNMGNIMPKQEMHFTFDVLTNILNRLPSTSIIRSQTVSKYWCNVIRSSDVLNARLESSLMGVQLTTGVVSGELAHFNFDDKGKIKKSVHKINLEGTLNYTFSNMVNGLACVYGIEDASDFYLVNLTTFETSKYSKREIKGITIYHDQISLGFDPSTGSYKFIRIYRHSKNLSYCCEILEIGVSFEGSWKIIGEIPGKADAADFANPYFLNGAIHWLVVPPSWLMVPPSVNKDKPLAFNMLKLDMKEDKFERVAPNMKNELDQNDHKACNGVYDFRLSGEKGKLYVLHWCCRRKYLCGWRLKESKDDEGVWNVVFRVNFALMAGVNPWVGLHDDDTAYAVGIVDGKVMIRSKMYDNVVCICDLVHKKISEHWDVYPGSSFCFYSNPNPGRLLFYQRE